MLVRKPGRAIFLWTFLWNPIGKFRGKFNRKCKFYRKQGFHRKFPMGFLQKLHFQALICCQSSGIFLIKYVFNCNSEKKTKTYNEVRKSKNWVKYTQDLKCVCLSLIVSLYSLIFSKALKTCIVWFHFPFGTYCNQLPSSEHTFFNILDVTWFYNVSLSDESMCALF